MIHLRHISRPLVVATVAVTTWPKGTPWQDPGVTAYDAVDGDLTDRVQVNGRVNHRWRGTYTVTYRVTDNAGNTATATRIVRVR